MPSHQSEIRGNIRVRLQPSVVEPSPAGRPTGRFGRAPNPGRFVFWRDDYAAIAVAGPSHNSGHKLWITL
jgi:hypothetical protein